MSMSGLQLTSKAAFIGHHNYLFIAKSHKQRPQLAAFEKSREKRAVGKVVDASNLCFGPMISMD